MKFKILTEQEISEGFSIYEDSSLVTIYRFDELLATFSAHGATRESLRANLDLIKTTLEPPCEED